MAVAAAADEDLTVLKAGPDGGSPRAMLSKYLNGEASEGVRRPPRGGGRLEDARGPGAAAAGAEGPSSSRRSATSPRRRRSTRASSAPTAATATASSGSSTRAGPTTTSRPCSTCPDGDAPVPRRPDALRPRRQRQGRGRLSARVHPARQERDRGALLRPDRPGRSGGSSSTPTASRPARATRPSTRWSASARCWSAGAPRAIASGTASAASTTSPSRPEVDPRRLGCTGCSGGGTMTSYLMALDDRIAAAAPSCYITSLERLFATIGPQDAEQNITGQVAFGLEHADYLGLRAPRPTLILSSTRDFFDQQGTWTTFREAKQTLRPAGPPRAGGHHRGGRAARLSPGRTARRWPAGCAAGCSGKDDAPAEGDDADRQGRRPAMHAGPARCSATSAASRSSTSTPSARPSWPADARTSGPGRGKAGAARGRPPPDRPARARSSRPGARTGARAKWGGGTVRKLVFATEPGIEVPARLFTPGEGRRGPRR